MQPVNHQRDGLAMFLDAAPDHQLSQGLAGTGHAMQSDFFLAVSLSPRRSFADLSFCWVAMAYLFCSAGRQ